MSLFKNKVGRPSNKTIKRRRIFYSVIAFLVLMVALTTLYMLNMSLNTNKIRGLSRPKTVNVPTFEIVGVDTNLKIGDKSYKQGEYIETNQIDNDIQNDLIVVPSGKRVGFNGRFPKTFYNSIFKNKFVYKVGIYDKNDNLIGNVNTTKIAKQDNQFDFTIDENVSYIKCSVTIDIAGYEIYPILEDRIYFATTSEIKQVDIEFSDSFGIKKNDRNIFEVPKYANYASYARINNSNKQTLYYRWFTFATFNTSEKPSYNEMRYDYCVASTDKIITTKHAFGLNVSKNYPERSGLVRVYLNKEQCLNDKTAKDASAIKEEIVKYKYNSASKVEFASYTFTPLNDNMTYKNNKLTKNKSIEISSSNDKVYANINETDKIKLSVKFPKTIYTLKNYDTQYIRFLAFDKSGKIIENQSTKAQVIDKESYSKDFTIDSSVKNIRISIYVKDHYNRYSVLSHNLVNVDLKSPSTIGNVIKISLKDKSGLKDENNVVSVTKTGDYRVVAQVTQTENKTLYYRWDTYNGLDAKIHTYTDTLSHGNYSYCSSFKDKSITFNSLETLEFKDKNTPRSGKFSLYSNQNDCKNEKNAVKSAIIGYKLAASTSTTKNTSNNITVMLEDKNGKEKNKNNIILVSELDSYHVKATITQTKGATLYYRWDTYNGLNAKTHNYTDTLSHGNYSYCSSFKTNEVVFDSLESLDFYNKNTPRSGKFSLYSSQSDCKNGKNAVKSAIINYDYGTSFTDKIGFKLLNNYEKGNATKTNIEKNIGRQHSDYCYDYAFAYGVYIMKNGSKNATLPSINDTCYYTRSYSSYGALGFDDFGSLPNTGTSSNYTKLYNAIIKKIDEGIPLVLWIDNSNPTGEKGSWGSGSHYVTVVGYKSATVNSLSSFSDNIWIIDPAPLRQVKDGSEEMYDGPLTEFGYKMQDYSQLSYWNKTSNAKIPYSNISCNSNRTYPLK